MEPSRRAARSWVIRTHPEGGGGVKRLVAVAGAVLLISSVAASAGAKGASEATIRGPGLEEPLTFSGYGESANDVNLLAERSGFFPAMFGQIPDPMEDNRPQKNLGLRYTIRYTVPNPAGGADEVVQYIFPYAEGGAVTYTPPGQPFMEGEGVDGERLRTKGGWYQGPVTLEIDARRRRPASESARGVLTYRRGDPGSIGAEPFSDDRRSFGPGGPGGTRPLSLSEAAVAVGSA